MLTPQYQHQHWGTDTELMISSGTNESSTSRDIDPVVCNMSLTIPNLVPQRPFYYLNFISVAKPQKFENETYDAHERK